MNMQPVIGMGLLACDLLKRVSVDHKSIDRVTQSLWEKKFQTMRAGQSIPIKANYAPRIFESDFAGFNALFHSYNPDTGYATFVREDADGRHARVDVSVNKINFGARKLELPTHSFVETPCNKETQMYYGIDETVDGSKYSKTFF